MQDVAYGITKLKCDSGETKTIPHVILSAKYSHVSASYIQKCSESQFEALSQRTMAYNGVLTPPPHTHTHTQIPPPQS